jgi:hypothetical protein
MSFFIRGGRTKTPLRDMRSSGRHCFFADSVYRNTRVTGSEKEALEVFLKYNGCTGLKLIIMVET